MTDLQVVANLEELISNLDTEVAALIMGCIENALDYRQKALSIYSILIEGKLVIAMPFGLLLGMMSMVTGAVPC